MNRCKDCKWWKVEKESWILDGGHECNSSHFVYMEKSDLKLDDGLAYVDSERYDATVETGPEFGCIHWEAK